MAVPAEIRTVPRPVNTIVDDSGTNSPKRYAVRQRASSKYIPGGNPQPKNGKVIGHIIDYKYVPLTDSTASDGPDMLSYGASALVKSVSADLLSDLSGKRSIQHHVHCDSSCHQAQDHSWKNGYPLP